jgi:inorganic pyrophosphatase
MRRAVLAILAVSCPLAAHGRSDPPGTLPATATTALAQSLEATSGHARHLWRDPPPLNPDGTINAYIEISRGDRRKWELDMRANERRIDRVMPEDSGGYPVNYGFVPQTVSYDGDPFDALVLGPPLPAGRIVRGVVAGLLLMEDDKGLDSKVVLSLVRDDGRPVHELEDGDRRRIGTFFDEYKRHEPGKFSRVWGWGSIADALAYVRRTHAFFVECRGRTGLPCHHAR